MFAELHLIDDAEPRAAAMNMAIDEALLLSTAVPVLRFYRWRSAAASFGYFGRFAEVAGEHHEREIVRRWTGGGIVLHGEDLTYSVIVPRTVLVAAPSSRLMYSAIHDAIRATLPAAISATLAAADAPKISAACFANPVRADVMSNGRKIAGAAQRRTRAGLLHQGSIQCDPLPLDFRAAFARALSTRLRSDALAEEVITTAKAIAAAKYATEEWLRRH